MSLSGPFDLFGREPEQPCRWCGEPTAQRLAPPGSAIEPVPMHAMCGAEVIDAYRRMLAGELLDTDTRERLAELAPPESAR